MNKIYRYLLILLASIAVSCDEGDSDYGIPNYNVQVWIDLNSPAYSSLRALSGSAYVDGGSKGIIVFHTIDDEYLAYDRHSTYEPENECVVELDSSFVAVEDPCSGSKWTLFYGSPISGPAELPLKQYTTYLSGNNLRIYN